MQVIDSSGFGISISRDRPSALVTFTLPDDVDVQGPAFLMFKATGVDLGFDRIYLNPQVPTPENPICQFPVDPNFHYLVTYLDGVVGGMDKAGYALVRPGLLRPGLNRLLICEDGHEDDDGLFDTFGLSEIILVYTITSER
ncbi:MAG: hypothetical protein D6723_10830 [Acidobacteria bacterium]|nr:MAG: hypothetical protein D6723_10830 [Acidobacteriota bacterium]